MRKRNAFLSWIGEGLSQGSSLGESGATQTDRHPEAASITISFTGLNSN